RERIEAATGRSFAELVAEEICAPLGLTGVRVARDLSDMQAIAWPEGRDYHPGWVYHGLILGPARAGAELLHGLAMGRLLSPDSLRQMQQRYPIGGPIPGRPWRETGYGLGLMMGPLEGAGMVWGHSGSGPFSVNAIYHFPGLADALTVACFTDGQDEALAEWEAVRIAMEAASG
ncbi:serine hydrolase, partial [Oceanicola sp. S124]|uniref:serine hydrolase n=1 Tax=Oceanicola sp. S124 TaxID=1042378 RepID=UPI0002558544